MFFPAQTAEKLNNIKFLFNEKQQQNVFVVTRHTHTHTEHRIDVHD
jgi:hypothetical protein